MSDNIERVLIIGGGVAGLAASIFLKKAGIKVTIFESKQSHDKSGAGFLLSPNGLKILKHLNCEQEILMNSTVIKDLHAINEENEEISVHRDYSEKHYNSPMINITRAHLVKVLLKIVKQLGIEIEYNKKFEYLKQSSKSVVATFEDGSKFEGDILIGADGTFSKTRQNIFPSLKLDYTGMWGVQGISSIKDPDFKLGSKYYSYAGKNEFSIFFGQCHPTNQDNILWQAFGFSPRKYSTKEFEQASADKIKSYMFDLMKDWNIPDTVYDMLENTKEVFARSIYSIGDLPSWSQGRVVLIGDALHTTNPVVGQGAAFSLEDAMYLAKMLKDHHYRDAFYYFETDRRPRVKKITERLLMEEPIDRINEYINDYHIEWNNEVNIK